MADAGECSMSKHQKSHSASRRLAFAGIFTAVSVILMVLGGVIPIATFTAPAFAGLCLVPVLVEFGGKTALLCYVAVSLLSFLFVPDREMLLLFVLLLGYYPIVQPYISRIKIKPLQLLAKVLLCTVSVIIAYSLLLLLFASPALRQEFGEYGLWFQATLLIVGNITFLLYDILIQKIKLIYQYRFRGRFIK